MPTLEIDNRTRFIAEPMCVDDEDGRPLLVMVVKATYDIVNDSRLALAAEQLPLNFTGEPRGEPDRSSFKYEPEVAWLKPATDVVLIAHAWAPHSDTRILDIEFSVGSVHQIARVFGERTWFKRFLGPGISDPSAFERIPLTYEHAFGGVDKSHPDPAFHTFDARNPIGRGFLSKKGRFEEGMVLPNIEDPGALAKRPTDLPAPVGFGFTCPQWQPRASMGGTYDQSWFESRAPRLPTDFDPRFFNAASPGLVAAGYLRGDEVVRGVGVTKGGRLAFDLPGQPPPTFNVHLKSGGIEAPKGFLDTVIVNTDDNKLILLWRAEVALASGPHDVLAVEVNAQQARATRHLA